MSTPSQTATTSNWHKLMSSVSVIALVITHFTCATTPVCAWLRMAIQLLPTRENGNDIGCFSVSFLEGRISNIHAACNYPTRNANLKVGSRTSDWSRFRFSFLTFYVAPRYIGYIALLSTFFYWAYTIFNFFYFWAFSNIFLNIFLNILKPLFGAILEDGKMKARGSRGGVFSIRS